MVPPEQAIGLGDDRRTIMTMRITWVEMMIIMLMKTTAMRKVIMMRMTTRAKPAEIVVAMPGATDKQVSAFVEAGPTDVFPNAAEYLARHGGRAPVMVKRDDVHNLDQ